MAIAKWQVFKNGNSLGFMTAAEIRQALRDGRVDPFDLVSREGSQLKVELVEVDEIFDVRREFKEDAAPTALHEETPKPAAAEAPAPQQAQRPMKAAANQSVMPGFYSPSFTKDEPTATAAFRRKQAKKYYLTDRHNRVLGPLAASEVQSLFYRGILDKGVKVQKIGETRTIPVHAFVAAYSGQQLSQLTASRSGLGRLSAPRMNLKSSRVLNELYRGLSTRGKGSRQFLPFIGIILIGAMLGIFVFLFLNTGEKRDQRDERPRRESIKKVRRQPKAERLQQPLPAPTLKRIAVKRPSPKPKPKPRPPKVEKKPTPKVAPRRSARKLPRPPDEPRVHVTTPVRRAVPREAPPPPPRRAPPPAPKPEPQQFVLREGEVATLRGVRFSRGDLDNCPLKCRLPIYLGGKKVVTAVFFKGAFVDRLEATSGTISISGNVKEEGGEFVIFLQSVK